MRDGASLVKKHHTVALVGNESFFKEEAARRFLELVRATDLVDEERFEPPTKINDIEDSLNEMPLIGKYRLISVRNTDKIKKWERLKDWISDPLPDVKAIFVFSDDISDLPPDWESISLKVVCNDMGPESQEFLKYIDFCLEGFNKTLDEEAKQLVIQTFSQNLAFMKHELQKACFLDPKSPQLTKEVLLKSLAAYPLSQVFDIVDIVIRRDRQSALKLLHELLNQGTEPALIIHLVAQRLKVIQGALVSQSYGEKLKDYMVRKKIPLFQFGSVLSGLKVLSTWQISRFYDVLCETDFHLRSFKDGRLEMERMIISLCS